MARLRSVRRAVAGLALSTLAAFPAASDEAARQLAAEYLAAGTLAEGDAALSAMLAADAANDDARFGLGVIRFVDAIENLSQGLYRYGLRAPDTMVLPIVRLPVPDNPNPEPVTYAAFRELLLGFVTDLASAEETLAGITSDEARLPLDLLEIRYDVDGDGTVGDDERFAEVIAVVTGLDVSLLSEGANEIAGDPPVGSAPGKGKPMTPAAPVAPTRPASDVSPTTLGFDRADALWLRGYTHVLMAFGEFLLAHDWQETFDTTFHLFFPESSFAFADALDRRRVDPTGFLGDAGPIADLISFVHLVRWQPTEPERMAAALAHLKSVIALSRETWDAVGRETDDDREWLPGPHQTSPFPDMPVDEERLAAWHDVLDEADAILDGEHLIPHWRFREGVNFRRIFEEPTTFDLVLWITGPAALPYLEEGVETSGEDWARIDDILRGGLAAYAAWFN
jgi:hypothetical protein